MARTAEIRQKDGKGRHTTTSRELFLLPNAALLVDSPGLREAALWAEEDSVQEAFPDVADLNPEADVKAFAGLTVPVIVAGRSIIAIGNLKWKRPPILCYIPAPDIFKQIRPDLRANLIDRYVDVGGIPGQLGEQLLQHFG